ncbi:MAG: class I SAM-dependent methyltransferase [Candidatus Woesearchaeota archaeon]
MVSLEDRLPSVPEGAQKREWDEIAVAYKEAIEQTSFYRQLSSEVVSEVKGCKRVIDLGCGTAAHLEKLLEANPGCEVVGVDSNLHMLAIAQQRLQQGFPNSRFRLHYADAVNFRAESGFDAVVSSNVLFNLDRPMDYLDNAYTLLSPGGILVLTSPQELSNMELAERMMREDFRRQGKYEEKRQHIDVVWRVNRTFPGRSNVYSAERMRDILLDFIGFDEILSQKTTYGSNFFFVAQKGEPHEVKYVFSDDPKLLKKGFRLRYHFLFDRLKAVDENREGVYMNPCDERSSGLFAMEGEKVVGFINYVPPGEDMPFSDKGLLDDLCKQYGRVGACNGFYVVKTRQGGRIGVVMVKTLMKEAAGWDIGAIVTEANPEIARSVVKFGWSTLKMVSSSHGGKELPSALMMAPLKQPALEYAIQEHANQSIS